MQNAILSQCVLDSDDSFSFYRQKCGPSAADPSLDIDDRFNMHATQPGFS